MGTPACPPPPPSVPPPPLSQVCVPAKLARRADLFFDGGDLIRRSSAVVEEHLTDGYSAAYTFRPLYRADVGASSVVRASIQGKQYLYRTVTSSDKPAVSVKALLRTPSVYKGRPYVRVAYQLYAQDGSLVRSSSTLPTVTITMDGSKHTVSCSAPTSGKSYVGVCSKTVSDAWLATGGTAEVHFALAPDDNSPHSLGSVAITKTPAWVQPVDPLLSGPGLACEMPTYPLYPGETFGVSCYAHTGDGNGGFYELDAFTVKVFHDASIEYKTGSVSGTSKMNSPTVSYTSGSRQVQVLVVGKPTSTDAADVTGSYIHLFDVKFQVSSSASAGPIASGITSTCTDLVNTGLVKFVGGVSGMMLDGSDATDDVNGAVDVVVVGNVGMFAHLQSSGTVHNTAHLNGHPVTSSLVAVTVNDNARTSLAVSAVSSPACNGTPTGFSLSGCTVQTDASHTASVSEVVTLSNGMYSIDVTVNTWVPSGVTMSVVDAELNLATPTTASCATTRYQSSSVTVTTTDGLDVTTYVPLSVEDSAVATISSDGVVRGLQAGATRIIAGTSAHLATAPLAITVSDTPVTVDTVNTALVTHVKWMDDALPSKWNFEGTLGASVVTSSLLAAEGDSGFVFVDITWSDGHTEPANSWTVDASSTTSSLLVTQPSADFWKAEVAFGAVAGCIEQGIKVAVLACDAPIGTGYVAVDLQLPEPTGIGISASPARIAPPGDDATRSPISLSTSVSFSVNVGFADNTQKDMTTDSRITYTIDAASPCATLVDNTAETEADASCTSFKVTATLEGTSLSATATIAVVKMQSLALSFTAYPSNNAALAVSSVGLVQCTSQYHQASAVVVATLTDGTTHTVTSGSTMTSSDIATVLPAGSRLKPQQAGSSTTITAGFGSSSATADLGVTDTVADKATAITWNIPTQASSTLKMTRSSTRSTTVDIEYASGVKFNDIGGSTFSGWLTFTDLVSFSNPQTEILDVTTAGACLSRSCVALSRAKPSCTCVALSRAKPSLMHSPLLYVALSRANALSCLVLSHGLSSLTRAKPPLMRSPPSCVARVADGHGSRQLLQSTN